ncbi:MAG: NAD-dependent epimerase/dehydratase family protein [Actinomycetota bacterium]
MRALVTGVAGFVGSRLAWQLLEQRHEVRGVDALTPYYDQSAKRDNLAPLLRDANFSFDEADLRMAPLDELVAVDVVFHLAAQPGVRASWGDTFADYVGHNVLATQRLLEACRTTGTRVVLASSSSVYGEAERHPTPEDVVPRPVSPYGVTKLAAEQLLTAYTANFGLFGVALRYFTVYGPGQRPDMAFHRFIRAALAGETIEVYGDGEQTRDVTFVDDAVAATIAAASVADPSDPINVGGGLQVALNEVLGAIERLTGRDLHIERREAAPGDVRHTSADLGRARRLLGYAPSVDLEEGLRREIAWMRARPRT